MLFLKLQNSEHTWAADVFSDKINKLIKDPVLRKTIGEKAQQYVAIEHSSDMVAQRIETALKRL